MARKAYNDIAWIRENDEIIGIALGYDFAAEHEWGCEDICDAFGIGEKPKAVGENLMRMVGIEPKPLLGIEARMITRIPQNSFHFIKKDDEAFLFFRETYGFTKPEETLKHYVKGELSYNEYGRADPNIATAWSGQDFFIRVRTDEYISALENIYEAFMRKDIAQGWKGAFMGAGLTFVIASKVPEEAKVAIQRKDESALRLKKAFEKSGIEEILKAAGKKWFALSPRWTKEDESEFKVWLNPMEQQKHNYGWFTIDELKQWAEDKGPIPMKGEK